MCVAIERSLAMLRINPFLPSSRPGMAVVSVKTVPFVGEKLREIA
jgi:hypothetical protein